ncbi:MAG: hypothetical protein WEB06_12525 [Actinomycetota bacterium]
MNRKRRLTLIALGAAVSLLLGSGLLALASDSVTSTGNTVTSGTFAHDVKAARVSDAAECGTATYEDGPFTALLTWTTTLGEETSTSTDVFCLRNDGSAVGQLSLTFQNIVDTEVGACESSESAAGDTSCQDGDAGELSQVLAAQTAGQTGSTSGSCTGTGRSSFANLGANSFVFDADLAPGEICALRMTVFAEGGQSDDTYAQAQTDRVQWDITFTLQGLA